MYSGPRDLQYPLRRQRQMCIRYRGSRGRVLLRKSGTEPLVRVMVEANDAQDSTTWAEHIADAVRKVTE